MKTNNGKYVALGLACILLLVGALMLSPSWAVRDAKPTEANGREQPIAAQQEPAAIETKDGRLAAAARTGIVVDMHSFLANPSVDPMEQSPDGSWAFLRSEVPIGLWVTDSEKVNGVPLVAEPTLYLIVFDPQDSNQKSAYLEARKLIGSRATITGMLYDRAGVNGLSIEKVEKVQKAAAEPNDNTAVEEEADIRIDEQ